MSSGRHPAKQLSSSLPSCALRLRLGRLRSSCAGQKHMAFSPLRVATSNLSNTSSKSASILGVSFVRAGRLAEDAPRNASPPLERDPDYLSLRPVSLAFRGSWLVRPRRLDPDYLVLLDTLSVLGCLKHHNALAADEVLRSPP